MRERSALTKLLLGTILVLMLGGCAIEPQRGRKPSPDWSRGTYVGQFIRGTVGIAVDGDGSRVHIVWPYQRRDEMGLQYVQLDHLARQTVNIHLSIASGGPLAPKLLMATNGQVHLFWASRAAGEDEASLWHVLLDNEGQLAGAAYQFQARGVTAGVYDVASDGKGGAYIVWQAPDDGGIYGVPIQADGTVDQAPSLITSQGVNPVVRVDDSGTVHLAWLSGASVYYAWAPERGLDAVTETRVASVPTGTGVGLVGPALGLSDGWVYVLWSLQNQSGLEAGTARTAYLSFPIGNPAPAREELLWFYSSEEQPYRAYEGFFPLTQVVRAAPPSFGADFVFQPMPLQGELGELATALVMSQEYRQDVHLQVSVALFESGELKGYQLATKTDAFSRDPAIAKDAAGNLHTAWREGAAGNRVYYATTAPEAVKVLDRLDEQDLMHTALQGSVEGLSGLAMFPFALVWIAPGLLLLGVVELVWGQEGLTEEVSRALLGIAIVLYLAAKLVLFPTVLTYVPLSAWLDLPRAWQVILRVGVPIGSLGLGLLVALRVRKQRSPSNFVFYFTAAAIDAVITLVVYGINFWSAV